MWGGQELSDGGEKGKRGDSQGQEGVGIRRNARTLRGWSSGCLRQRDSR